MNATAKNFTAAFILFTILDIIAVTFNISSLHYIAKPLLIPALIALLLTANTTAPYKKLIVIALFFSWFGDIFLLLENFNKNFFIFGLVCFLITHIFYIIYFLKIASPAPSLLKKQPVLPVLVGVYGLALVWLLYPHLADLKIPVMVYAVVICTMLICSLHVYLKVNKPSNALYILGAGLFVLSDSALAINKFYQPYFGAGVLIMITYCAAQYCIVRAFIAIDN